MTAGGWNDISAYTFGSGARSSIVSRTSKRPECPATKRTDGKDPASFRAWAIAPSEVSCRCASALWKYDVYPQWKSTGRPKEAKRSTPSSVRRSVRAARCMMGWSLRPRAPAATSRSRRPDGSSAV
jgi:hypothetical protein